MLILADSQAAITAVKKAGRVGKARSRHLQKVINKIAEVKDKGGEVKIGWVKVHMGILGNKVAAVVAKKAAEEVGITRSGCRGGGGHPGMGLTTKRDYVEGEGEGEGEKSGSDKKGDGMDIKEGSVTSRHLPPRNDCLCVPTGSRCDPACD